MRADYRMAKETRFQSRMVGVNAAGSGADYHYRTEAAFFKCIERARYFQRNDPIVGQGVRRLVANIVQDGFTLDIDTGDKGLDSELKARWYDWSSDPDQCHSEGEMTFNSLERLLLSSVVVDGDAIILPLKTGSLQMVEAHRLRTPRNTTKNVVHGVLMDDAAKRLEYWLTKDDIGLNQVLKNVSDIQRYPARDSEGNRQVLHIYNPDRFSQRRGVTALAPVGDMVGFHDDIQFATLVKAQTASLIGLLHERGANWEPLGDSTFGGQTTESMPGGSTRTIQEIGAGLEFFSDKDEKLSAFSPNIPSPEFFPHAMMILQFISINLDLPVCVLLLDPSNTNFSGWRGAIDQARLRFKQIQRWLVGAFHSPVYRWKVRQWLADEPAMNRMMDRGDVRVFAHRWNPPTFPYIEPMTDASSDLLQQRNGLNSPRRIQAARGRDWDDVSTEIVDDNFMAIDKAIAKAAEINAKHPDSNVHWRELISLPTPDGMQVNVVAGGQQPNQQPGGQTNDR